MRDLLWQLFQVCSPALLALIGWLSLKLADLIKAKTDNAYVQGVLLRLNDAVWTAVREVEQTMVGALKATNTDGSGKLTETSQANAKTAAINTIKEHLGPKGLAELGDIIGVAGPALDQFLGKRVEAVVNAAKAPAVPTLRP